MFSKATLQFPQFGRIGRFGNQIFQYAFLLYARQAFGCRISLPEEPDQRFLFQSPILEKPQPADHEIELGFWKSPAVDLEKLHALLAAKPDARIDLRNSFFQHHTGTLSAAQREVFTAAFHPQAPTLEGEPHVKAILKDLWQTHQSFLNQSVLLALHVRRGDYLLYNRDAFFSPELSTFFPSLDDLIRGSALERAVLYIASDDLPYCRDQFQMRNLPFRFVCAEDFYPGADQEILRYLFDFLVMMHADVLCTANSSFSIAAAMLNQRAKVFLRPSPHREGYIPFHPWNTAVLVSKRY